MKRKLFLRNLIMLIVIVSLCSCEVLDVFFGLGEDKHQENRKPGQPILLDPQFTSAASILLRWQSSFDPDGDAVAYIVLCWEYNGNSREIGRTGQTQFEVMQLILGITYQWQIIAEDSRGMRSLSVIRSFSVSGNFTPSYTNSKPPYETPSPPGTYTPIFPTATVFPTITQYPTTALIPTGTVSPSETVYPTPTVFPTTTIYTTPTVTVSASPVNSPTFTVLPTMSIVPTFSHTPTMTVFATLTPTFSSGTTQPNSFSPSPNFTPSITPSYSPVAFDFDGKLVSAIGSADDYGRAVALQSDGKIIVAGQIQVGLDFDFGIARYWPNGSLDSGFGNNGRVITDIGGYPDCPNAVAVQTDGKIIAAGMSNNGGSNADFALVRYLANGALDLSFGISGIVTTDISSGSTDIINSILILPDGKILAGGYSRFSLTESFAIARYTTSGELDTSFNTSGYSITSINPGYSSIITGIALDSNNRIVAGGYCVNSGFNDFAVARFNYDGTLDTSFNGTGKNSTSIGSSDDCAYAVITQGNRIFLAGSVFTGPYTDFALVCYTSSGILDNAFGTNGIVTTNIGSGPDTIYSMQPDSDGKILVAGCSLVGMNNIFSLARYNNSGQLDVSFDYDGIVTTMVGSGECCATSLLIQPDSKILAAGYSSEVLNDFALARYYSNGKLDDGTQM